MHISKIILLTAAFLLPATVFADHSDLHTIQQLQTQLAAIQQTIYWLLAAKPAEPPGQAKKATTTLPTAPVTPATPAQPTQSAEPTTPAQQATPVKPAVPTGPTKSTTPAAASESASAKKIEQLKEMQNTVQSLQEKLKTLEAATPQLPSPAPVPVSPTSVPKTGEVMKLGRSLQSGSSGSDVRQLQELLKQFPDIYPQGLVTGYFGQASSAAVKKLQEKFGLEPVGSVGLQTRKKIEELSLSVARKHPPKITAVSPVAAALDAPLTVTGSGLTLTENKIMVRGKIVAEHIASVDGVSLVVFLSSDTPCRIGQACAIKVVNTNGISNAKSIKIIESIPPPSDTPPSPPPTSQDVASPIRSEGMPTGVLPYGTVQATISLFTSENATCRYATVAGTVYSSMTGVFSATGGTTHSSVVSGLGDGISYSYFVRCRDAAGNANSDDFTIAFSVDVPPPPTPEITSIAPSMGVAGTQATLSGTGFTATGNSVNFGGTNNAVTGLSSADKKILTFTVPSLSACQPIQSCSVSVTNANGTSNTVLFKLLQSIVSVSVAYPNGGERLLQGTDYTIRWSGGKDRVDVLLVGEGATLGADPSEFISGYLAVEASPSGSYTWNAKRACDRSGDTCFDVSPGNYKILVVSEDEFGELTIWDSIANKAGTIDLSDGAFAVLPTPSVTVVSPNGGEAYIRGTSVTIVWDATSVVSRLVNINLLKGGVFLKAIAANVPLSADSGLFTHSWTITTDIPFGDDYAIEIVDAAHTALRDVSDARFGVVSGNKIEVLSPNGGETWIPSFKGHIFWYASTTNPVTINLWKGGVFYRTLATGVPSTGFSGYTFQMLYKWPARYYRVDIPSDIPVGDDYTLEIVDQLENVRDRSNAQFRVIALPHPVTVTGRFIDKFTQKPMANIYYDGWGTQPDGSTAKLASGYTDVNGAFSVVASTTDMLVREYSGKSVLATWPACYMASGVAFSRYYDALYATYNKFDPVNPPLWTTQPQDWLKPIYSYVIDFANMPFWPAVNFQFYSDTPVTWMIWYPPLGMGYGSSGYSTIHSSSNIVPLNYNLRAELTDQAGVKYYSPYVNLPLDYGCAPKTLSFFGGKFQWEPYNINVLSYVPYYATVGTAYKGTYSASGGTAPYIWSILSGSLPPGVSLDPATGIISGTPITIGTYAFQTGVVDANGVHSGYRYGQIVVK